MAAIPAACRWCGLEFTSKSKCEKHSRSCRPFACGQCDEKFKSKKALHDHLKTHRQQWQCNLCSVEPFNSQRQLEEHCYRDHEMPIACPLCDKTFTSLHGRDRHVEVQHSETWAFQCPCGLKLQDAKKLEKHAEHCTFQEGRHLGH